jgi:hypothetical protein
MGSTDDANQGDVGGDPLAQEFYRIIRDALVSVPVAFPDAVGGGEVALPLLNPTTETSDSADDVFAADAAGAPPLLPLPAVPVGLLGPLGADRRRRHSRRHRGTAPWDRWRPANSGARTNRIEIGAIGAIVVVGLFAVALTVRGGPHPSNDPGIQQAAGIATAGTTSSTPQGAYTTAQTGPAAAGASPVAVTPGVLGSPDPTLTQGGRAPGQNVSNPTGRAATQPTGALIATTTGTTLPGPPTTIPQPPVSSPPTTVSRPPVSIPFPVTTVSRPPTTFPTPSTRFPRPTPPSIPRPTTPSTLPRP